MAFLMDSHILLWAIENPDRLSKKVRDILVNSEDDVFASAISIAELRIKQKIGKLNLPENFEEILLESGFSPLDFSAVHAHVLQSLPLHHRDPFDRMLIAQALAENLTLITAGRDILKYDVKLLAN
jgi:PIN domain nuclease of toxin-antitoxin system